MKKNVLINNKLRIAITNQCNLSCFYCHNEGQPICNKKQFISMDYIKSMIEWFKDNDVYIEVINITGGEPLLHPNLLEIIDECKLVCDQIHLNTNATLLTKELIDILSEKNVQIKVGIDSFYAEQTKPNIYTTKNNVEKVLELMKYAATKTVLELNTVLTKYNYKDIDDMIEFAMDMGAECLKVIKLNDLNPRGLNEKNNISEDFKTNQKEPEIFWEIQDRWIRKAWHYDVWPYRGKVEAYIKKEDESEFVLLLCDEVCACGGCANLFTPIDSNGDLMICPKRHITEKIDFTQDYDTVSNILKQGRLKMCDSSVNRYDLRDNFEG